MPKHYVKKQCGECDKFFNKLYRRGGKMSCYRCFIKKMNTIKSPNMFDEYLDKKIVSCFTITTKQDTALKGRLEQSGMSLGLYLRALMLSDLGVEK